MMPWKAYQLVYKAVSPIHIGWHTLGYIKLTRPYITGRTMWGSFIANLVRSGLHGSGYEDYGAMEKLLRHQLLVSYFYPALDPSKPLIPKWTDKGLKYGDYMQDEFEKMFIRSFGQTAVFPETNTAEDQSLHESEFISPIVKEDGSERHKQVYFVGHVFLNEKAEYRNKGISWQELLKPLQEISVGGERKYGWGRLVLERCSKVTSSKEKFFGHETNLSQDALRVTIHVGVSIPAHLFTGSSTGLRLKGDIEPLVGREWGTVKSREGEVEGSGQKISNALLCWMPGSVLSEEPKFPFYMGAYGILKCEGGDARTPTER